MSVMKALTIFAQIAGVAQGAQVTCGPRTIPVELEKQDGRLYFRDSEKNQFVIAESSSWKVEVFEKGVMLNNGTEPGTYRMQNGTIDLSISPLVDLCRKDLEALLTKNSTKVTNPRKNSTITTADSFTSDESTDFMKFGGKLAEVIGNVLDYFGVFGSTENGSQGALSSDNNTSHESEKMVNNTQYDENGTEHDVKNSTATATVTPKLYFKVNITSEEEDHLRSQAEF